MKKRLDALSEEVSRLVTVLGDFIRLVFGIELFSSNPMKGSMIFSQVSPKLRRQTMANLKRIERELARCRHKVKTEEMAKETETFYLQRIRVMEDLRFQLLSQVNGQNLSGYNTLPIYVE